MSNADWDRFLFEQRTKHPLFVEGREYERGLVVKHIQNRICFDYLRDPETCEHQGCHMMAELLRVVEKHND